MQNIEQIYEQYCNTVYRYLFCLTHNEDVEVPDLTGYAVEYTSNEEIENLLSE